MDFQFLWRFWSSSMSKQVVEETRSKDRRIAKSVVVAMSCEIVRLDQTKETYKVQSETDAQKYYTVKFIDGTPVYCSCKDFEIQIKRNEKHLCKHMRSIVIAENNGLVVTNQHNNIQQSMKHALDQQLSQQQPKSWESDNYDF